MSAVIERTAGHRILLYAQGGIVIWTHGIPAGTRGPHVRPSPVITPVPDLAQLDAPRAVILRGRLIYRAGLGRSRERWPGQALRD
jgi:hypothetical protein